MINLKKIYHILLVLYPILSGYGFSAQLDLGLLLTLMVGGIYVFHRNEKVRFIWLDGYKLFFTVSVVLSIVFLKTVPSRLILFTINLIIALCCVDVDLLKKYYGKVVAACCVFFVLQEISFHLCGSRISGITTLIPTIYGSISAKYIEYQKIVPRSATFFLEPS